VSVSQHTDRHRRSNEEEADMRRRTLQLTALALTAAAAAPGAAAADVDLRSPDTRDAAAGRDVASTPQVVFVKGVSRSPERDGGIDWGDVGLGAGGLAVVVGLGAAGAFVTVRRLHPAPARQTPAVNR
jgi:hypothetical protein